MSGREWCAGPGTEKVHDAQQPWMTVPHWRVFQHEARLRGPKGKDGRVGALLRSHGSVVVTDCLSRALAGQTVSDQVGLASHVLNVRSKLRYGRQLTLLARAPRIRNLGHGEGQRLMVNVRGKTGTLAEKSKMLCCEMESQQLSVRNTVLTLSISERVTEKGKGLPDAGDPLFQHGAQRYIQRVDGQCDLR